MSVVLVPMLMHCPKLKKILLKRKKNLYTQGVVILKKNTVFHTVLYEYQVKKEMALSSQLASPCISFLFIASKHATTCIAPGATTILEVDLPGWSLRIQSTQDEKLHWWNYMEYNFQLFPSLFSIYQWIYIYHELFTKNLPKVLLSPFRSHPLAIL